MNLALHQQVESFIERVSSFLSEKEGRNNLLFGILATIQTDRSRYEEVFLADVAVDDNIQLVVIQTPPFNVVLSDGSEDAARFAAQSLQEMGRPTGGVTGLSEVAGAFADEWCELAGTEVSVRKGLLIYELTEVIEPRPAPGKMRKADLSDLELTLEWMTDFAEEAELGTMSDPEQIRKTVLGFLDNPSRGLYFWLDPDPVSMGGFGGATPNGVRINAVYTPPAYRGRGYASNLVARVSQTQLDAGRRFCFLFTDASNPTSNHIYQQIGYRQIAEASELHFSSG